MEDYKSEYNSLLARYNNGCKYLEKNPSERAKWLPELIKIMDELDRYIKEYSIEGENVLGGFKC